jgi:hypothetical protein
MRQFARPFPIDRLSLEARVLYTGFLLFLLLGFLSSAWLYRDSFGALTAEGAETYYRGGGEQAEPAAAPEGEGSGPALELPEEETAAGASERMRIEKPARQVIETFHFHLFTVPVVLLIVGHLFMLTSLKTGLKTWVIAIASVATFVHLLAPLAVRFGSPGWAWLMPSSVVVAAVGWLPMLIWPLWELWRPSRMPPTEPEAR